jgi:hypothetical protein
LFVSELGYYSTQTEYVHGKVTVHLDDALILGDDFIRTILAFYELIQEPLIQSQPSANAFVNNFRRTELNHTLETFLGNVDREMSRIHELKKQAPHLDQEAISTVGSDDAHLQEALKLKNNFRTKRGVPLAAGLFNVARDVFLNGSTFISNIFGGLFGGGYETGTNEQIKEHQEAIERVEGILTDTTRTVDYQEEQINSLFSIVKEQEDNLHRYASTNVIEFNNKCELLYNLLKDYIDRLEDLVQMGMIQRLSTKYLNATGSLHMFNDLVDKAVDLETKLVINKPTDLYQLDVTMTFEAGGKISLFVHVPVVNTRTTSKIVRLADFPIDIEHPTHVATIDTRDKVFVVPVHKETPDSIFVTTESELTKCKVYNKVYFCDKSVFVSEDQLTHCISALFYSKFEEASKYCTYKFSRNAETIFRSGLNEYLVHATETKQINEYCDNIHARSAPILKGVNYVVRNSRCVLDLVTNFIPVQRSLDQLNSIIHMHFPVTNIHTFMGFERQDLDLAIYLLDMAGHVVINQKQITSELMTERRFAEMQDHIDLLEKTNRLQEHTFKIKFEEQNAIVKQLQEKLANLDTLLKGSLQSIELLSEVHKSGVFPFKRWWNAFIQ